MTGAPLGPARLPRGIGSWAARRRPVARSAAQAVDRGLVSLALAWQLLWAVADSRAWPLEVSGGATTAVMLVSAALWAVLLVAHLVRGRASLLLRVLDVAGLVAAGAAITAAVVRTPEHDWLIASSWAVLPAGVAGLLLPVRWALPVVLLVSGGVGVAAFEFLGPSGNEAAAHDVLYAAYALSVGVVTIMARRILLRDARAADRAAVEAAEAVEDRMTAELVEAARQREQRVLHETVLNTLTAIVRGGTGSPEMRPALTRRCWEAARVLRDLRGRQSPSAGPDQVERRLDLDLAPELEELRVAGVDVAVDCGALLLPAPVYEAVLTATREALANARRHASASRVAVRSQMTEGGVRVEVRDDGRGFTPGAPEGSEGRFGLTGAIAGSLAAIGGSSRVTSAPGAGTVVLLAWRPERREQRIAEPVSGAALALPVLLAFGAYSTAVFALGLPEALAPWLGVLAFAVFLALAVLVGWASRRGTLPWWVVLATAGIAPVVYQLQQMSGVVGDHQDWGEWSSGAIAALFVVLIAAGPRHAWLVVLPAWLVIQGDVLGELLAAGTAILLASALFARSARRSAQALHESREATAAAAAAERAAIAHVERIAQRYRALEESAAVELLVGIADGALDPEAPDVRRWADLEERFIRTLLRIDPSVDALHGLVVELAVRARRRGILLDVAVPGRGCPDGTGLASVRPALLAALDAGEPGGQARLTVQEDGDGAVLRLVVPVRADARAQAGELRPPGLELAPGDVDMLWEVRLPVAGAHDREPARAGSGISQ